MVWLSSFPDAMQLGSMLKRGRRTMLMNELDRLFVISVSLLVAASVWRARRDTHADSVRSAKVKDRFDSANLWSLSAMIIKAVVESLRVMS